MQEKNMKNWRNWKIEKIEKFEKFEKIEKWKEEMVKILLNFGIKMDVLGQCVQFETVLFERPWKGRTSGGQETHHTKKPFRHLYRSFFSQKFETILFHVKWKDHPFLNLPGKL